MVCKALQIPELKPSPGAPPSGLQGFADPWAASVVFRNQVQLEPPLHSQCIQPQQDQVAEHSNGLFIP